MPYFNESQLEQSIIALLQEQGYEDYLKRGVVTAHFRFDAAVLPSWLPAAWGVGTEEAV